MYTTITNHIELDREQRHVRKDGQEIHLTGLEYGLLDYLSTHVLIQARLGDISPAPVDAQGAPVISGRQPVESVQAVFILLLHQQGQISVVNSDGQLKNP